MTMFLRFLQFGMVLLSYIAAPFIVILASINGWGGTVAKDSDVIGKTGMNNIQSNSLWLWFHAVGVWYVVWIVHEMLEKYQGRFLRLRLRWWRSMPEPRSTTVMLLNIPASLTIIDGTERPEEKLKQLINNKIFKFISSKFAEEGVVNTIDFVKPAGHLKLRLEELRRHESELQELRAEMSRHESHSEQVMPDALVSSIREAEENIKKLKDEVAKEKERVKSEECSSTAFVTFKNRYYADLFMHMRIKTNDYEFIQMAPPDPKDVDWDEVLGERRFFGRHLLDRTSLENGYCCKCIGRKHSGTVLECASFLRWILGYTLIALLFVLYIPIVTTISTFTKLGYVEEVVPAVQDLVIEMPFLANMWDAIFASAGITVFMGLLPSLLMIIQRNCFSDVSERLAQLGMERWYFNFLLVFVVFVTAISGSIMSMAENIIKHPISIFDALGTRLSQSSHFYLQWCVLQSFTFCFGLVRFMQVVKFVSIRAGSSIFMPETVKSRKAKYWSEPENADCYGIGARTAETTLVLAVALVFCSLLPIICLFGIITLAFARTVYGYLLVYAETRKPDLGGLFWCQQLHQVHTVMFFYSIMMTGVFSWRAMSTWPRGFLPFFVAATIPYNFYRYKRYQHTAREDVFPLLDESNEVAWNTEPKDPLPADSYRQPELRDDSERQEPTEITTDQPVIKASSRAQQSAGTWKSWEEAEPGLDFLDHFCF